LNDLSHINLRILPLPVPFHPIPILISSLLIAPLIWIIDKIFHLDLIYVRDSLPACGILSVKSLSRKTCVKLAAIMEEENPMWGKFLSWIYMLADKVALTRAKVIGVHSPLLLRKIVVRRQTLPRGKIVLTPPGIDSAKIEIIKNMRGNYKETNTYTVGFIGFLAHWQGVEILVKAVGKVKESLDKPVTLLIVGDGPERRKIEKLCRNLNVDCHITGFVEHEKHFNFLEYLTS